MTASRDETAKPETDLRMMDGQMHQIPAPATLTLGATAPSQVFRSIFFLDEHRLTRDCLSEAIQDHCPEMQVVGLSPVDYRTDALGSPIALIIFNLHHASIHAAASALRLSETQAAPPVIFITTRDERSEAMQAMEHGVNGLVPADAHIDLLIAAIRLVIAGGRYFPADTLTALMAKAPPATSF